MDRKLHATDNCSFMGRGPVGAAGPFIDVQALVGGSIGVMVTATMGRMDGASVIVVSAELVGTATTGKDMMDTGKLVMIRTGGDAGAPTT